MKSEHDAKFIISEVMQAGQTGTIDEATGKLRLQRERDERYGVAGHKLSPNDEATLTADGILYKNGIV